MVCITSSSMLWPTTSFPCMSEERGSINTKLKKKPTQKHVPVERSWTYRLGNGVDDSGEAHSIVQLLLLTADTQSSQQRSSSTEPYAEFCCSHLLSLQLLLFPSLPLLLVHFADLDKSFLLHTHTYVSFIFFTTEDIFAEMYVFTFWVSTVSTWSPLGNLVQGRQIRDFSYKSTSSSTSITPATLTSSSASGRSAFFETWEPTEQRDYSYTSTLYLLAFKSRTDYPVQGSKSRVFSVLLKRASTFSLKNPGDTSHITLTLARQQETARFFKRCIAMGTYCDLQLVAAAEMPTQMSLVIPTWLCWWSPCAPLVRGQGLWTRRERYRTEFPHR